MTDALKTGTEFITPRTATLIVDGLTVVVSPVVSAQFGALLTAAEPIIWELASLPTGFADRLEAGALTADDKSDLFGVCARNWAGVLQVVQVCAKVDADWLGQRLLDRTVELAITCLAVNADFFARARTNLLAGLVRVQSELATVGGNPVATAAAAATSAAPVGQTSSAPSSPPATATAN